MYKELTIAFAMSVFLVGCTQAPASSENTKSQSTTSSAQATSSAAGTKTFTLSEIASSNSRSNCKMAINGKVYDVTSYVNSHPGGAEILKGCGKDATALFTGTASEGRDHSTTAEAQLARFYVGELE